MADPFLAEIRAFGFDFAPRGWARCDGQVLPINQNTALFSLLGTNFGGDGRASFALPNLSDRFAMGAGDGPGLTPRSLGETDGLPTVTLTTAEMPAHKHTLRAAAGGTGPNPLGAALAPPANGSAAYRNSSNTTAMAAGSLGTTGGNQPHENRQPFLAVNFCIAMQGIFPPRG